MKFRSSWIFFVVLGLVLVLGKTNVFAQATEVRDFNRLKEAVAQGGEIQVTQHITVTESLEVQNNVTISGSKLILGDGFTSDQMFKVGKNVSLTLKDITLDSIILEGEKAGQGRFINVKGGTVNLENVILKNGSTEKLKAIEKNGKDEQNYSGGAILATENSTVTIVKGSFEGNNTGTKYLDAKRAAEGGAIKIDSSKLNITGTTFKGNHLDSLQSEGGRQGGAIEATNTTVVIKDANFTIPGPFDTGGAIKFENCPNAEVTGSSFTIDANKGQFGIAGGAITSEGSNLTIEDSTFKAGDGTRVAEAGGLIQVVGVGSFNLSNSTLEGAGAWWNAGKYTANTGGAISFYDDSTVTAKITGTTIKNFMVDGDGAGIALSKGNKHSSKVNLTLEKTSIENASAYTWQANSYGGCMYIGQGNTVKIIGGKISGQTASNVAGGIYNMGDLEITGGAQITGNTGYQMVGGIYHGGKRLKIDDASFSKNQKGDNSTGDNHMLGKTENSGINIYADEDVIITPEATFDGNDIRVFDGQSKLLLTGKLKNQINVSISEKEKKMAPPTNPEEKQNPLIKIFEEDRHRKVGYIVAKGTEGYEPTKEDAQQIHYLTKDTSQAVADFTDHTSPGKWDFVLNPENNQIVLGQRVKLIYHGNLGKIGTEDKKEETVDVYKNKDFWQEQEEKFKVDDPTRDKNSFMGWYYWKDGEDLGDEETSIQDIKKPDSVTKDLFDFSKVKFSNNEQEIVNIITPNVINTYAGWSKNIDLEVVKKWEGVEEADKKDITVTLYDGESQVGEAKTFTKENTNYGGKFENLPVFTKSGVKNMELRFTPKTYTVKEELEGFTPSYSPVNGILANSDQEKKITITNTKAQEFGVAYEFVSGTEGRDLPDTIRGKEPKDDNKYKTGAEVEAQAIDNKIYTDATKKTVQASDGVWTFKGWKPEKQKIDNSDIKFTGTWTFIEDNPSFKITKTVDKKEYKKDDILNYTVTITNTGNSKIENLSVSDPLATKVKWKLGQGQEFLENQDLTGAAFILNVGESLIIQYEYKVTEADITKETIENTAKATLGEESKEAKTKSDLKKEQDPDLKPPVQESTTNYLDQNGNKISPSDKGTQNPKDIPGYKFIKTEKPSDQVTNHIYKKIVKDGPPRITFWAYPTEPEPVSDKGLLNKEDHKAYMFGYDDGNFGPEDNMTREEVTAMFARLLKDYPRDRRSYQMPYSDVSKKNWSYEAIGFMTEKGMVKGYQDGSFRPKAPVTRAEFAAMASRFDRLMGGQDRGFKDVNPNHWAFEAINSAAAKGWVKGYPDGTFKPDQKITRSEVVSITNIMLDRYADKDFVRKNIQDMIYFKDLTEANWAYFPIMEATHGHDYTRKALQEENWIRLNGEEFRFPLLYRK